jgi:hypothetical protein
MAMFKNKPDEEVNVTEMPKINIDDVSCAYIGVPNLCMCGCSGDYFYSEKNRNYSSKERGYKVDDEEINDEKIDFVIRKMGRNAEKGIQILYGYIFTLIVGKRQYTIYLVKGGD